MKCEVHDELAATSQFVTHLTGRLINIYVSIDTSIYLNLHLSTLWTYPSIYPYIYIYLYTVQPRPSWSWEAGRRVCGGQFSWLVPELVSINHSISVLQAVKWSKWTVRCMTSSPCMYLSIDPLIIIHLLIIGISIDISTYLSIYSCTIFRLWNCQDELWSSRRTRRHVAIRDASDLSQPISIYIIDLSIDLSIHICKYKPFWGDSRLVNPNPRSI